LLAGGAWCIRRTVLHPVKTKLAALTPRQRLLLASAAFSIAIAASSLADAKGLRRLSRLRSDIERQEQKNRELRVTNARLRRTVDSLSPPVDGAALEKAVREQLGFVREGELLFKFE
jgi:cell division protein FtsB